MGATNDNFLALSYTFETDIEGNTLTNYTYYNIASDYVNPFGGETAHFQIVKTVYGTGDQILNITPSTPLPIQPHGTWSRYDYLANTGFFSLATTIVGYTGDTIGVQGVSGGVLLGITVGEVTVSSTNLDIRMLYGGTVGDGPLSVDTDDYIRIQGIDGAYPVGITVSSSLPVTISESTQFGIFGISGATALGVTFGIVDIRGLTAQTDSVLVVGGGTGSTVPVGLFGFEGGITVQEIYSENNALNVNVKTIGGVTISALDLDVRDLSYSSDSVTVVGQGAADQTTLSTVPTYINVLDSNGNLIQAGGSTGNGWSGAAVNVNVVNFDGISYDITVNVSSTVGVTAPFDGAIPVQGSPFSNYGLWVVGDSSGGPVTVQGNSGGVLPVQVSNINDVTVQTQTINATVDSVKKNTDFLIAVKKALYANNISVSSQDFTDDSSLYTLVKREVGDRLGAIEDTIVPANEIHTDQNSLAVNVTKVKRVSSFMSRTGFVGNTPVNLTSFNQSQGYTCEMGVRIKVSRIPTGLNASQNEIMCVISEADAASGTNFDKSYVMYHGDEMFFEVDNIDKIKVFYPALSSNNAPNNTGNGLVFSFYAS